MELASKDFRQRKAHLNGHMGIQGGWNDQERQGQCEPRLDRSVRWLEL